MRASEKKRSVTDAAIKHQTICDRCLMVSLPQKTPINYGYINVDFFRFNCFIWRACACVVRTFDDNHLWWSLNNMEYLISSFSKYGKWISKLDVWHESITHRHRIYLFIWNRKSEIHTSRAYYVASELPFLLFYFFKKINNSIEYKKYDQFMDRKKRELNVHYCALDKWNVSISILVKTTHKPY